MSDIEDLVRRSIVLLSFTLAIVLGAGGIALSNGNSTPDPELSTDPVLCDQATGNYWQYWQFFVNGRKKGIGKGLQAINGSDVNEALEGYFRKGTGWKTSELWQVVNDNKSRLNGFNEASGLMGYVWLQIARQAMDFYGTDELKQMHRMDVTVWGRINENHTDPHPTEKSYVYDASNSSGHIWATMCFEIRYKKSGGQDEYARYRYTLKTVVAPCGFKVIKRGTGMGSDPVFVGTFVTEFKANKVDADFKIKLEAVNFRKGDIACSGPDPADGYVTLGKAFFDYGDGNWMDLSAHTHLFTPNAEACVDMFFEAASQNDPPPADFGASSKRPNYCLGRCTDPPIVNSGM